MFRQACVQVSLRGYGSGFRGKTSSCLVSARIFSPQPARAASSATIAASAIVRGESDGEAAAKALVDKLLERLPGDAPNCVIWFAKGLGAIRAAPVGPLLSERFGPEAVVVGSSSEGGVIGDGQEVQDEPFALSALALRVPGMDVHPFHSAELDTLPTLGRGASWESLTETKSTSSPSPPLCVLALCSLPPPGNGDPQAWATLFDRKLSGISQGTDGGDALPVVVGGLTVGNHTYVDGETYAGGAFGTVLAPRTSSGVHLDAVVCQGAVPFGPWLEVTGALGDHVITELDGKNPRELLEPLLHGPEVPGEGHSMAGLFVDPLPPDSLEATMKLAGAALGGRPSTLVRPMHTFTPDGFLVLSPLSEGQPYAPGMRMQLHCFSKEHALENLRARAEHDMALHGTAPDAAVIVSCGARGSQLYGSEGVESEVLKSVWGKDVPTVGIFAGGEIGPVGLRTYVHGYTTSCLMIRSGST